mmetsp:Transcript_13819/g.20854  ORF Transcript_13819/g.20854 Transcript_13819/m.20854 type:complete len:407 (+) Transcript_13819:88-1308(+)|eukprot:CAMPEP_0167753280 /NCGR_PEP_ID=MMETSP0110_2-20121227/7621_1 /TAXON_ID=629695 /ORGANISM="Gymnochlora sp., Strain CCMP2014" /LENGTH=406 /DNA_ID=CAMNT_0007639019 /DNA_START=74 /DNA_END=1294 /DNA_ORIENTATION=-
MNKLKTDYDHGRKVGTIKSYQEQRGFGFIGRHDISEDIFFHIREFRNLRHPRLPVVGMEVEYCVGLGNNGRSCAKDILILNKKDQKERKLAASVSPQNKTSNTSERGELAGRSRGVVKYIREKYGFIVEATSSKKIFFFLKDVAHKDTLSVGDRVDFVMEDRAVVGVVAMDIRPYLVQNEMMIRDEDRSTEFKSLAKSNAPERAIGCLCNKYLCAFLNTSGGEIFFGVRDDGKVAGVPLSKYQRDTVRKELDFYMQSFTPPVDPTLYSIAFLKVYQMACGDLLEMPDRYVVRAAVKPPENGACRCYYDSRNEPWIRLDGGIKKMGTEMARRRLMDERKLLIKVEETEFKKDKKVKERKEKKAIEGRRSRILTVGNNTRSRSNSNGRNRSNSNGRKRSNSNRRGGRK